jgi:lycopene beta-cyclase
VSTPDPVERVDVLVIGAGVAGLSLACELAASRLRDRRILVLDDGSRPLPDRSWAYWTDHRRTVHRAAAQSVDRLAVHTLGRDRLLRPERYRYELVTGADLLALTRSLAAGAPGLQLRRGHVEAVARQPDGVTVTVDGHPIRAALVFDSVGVPGATDGGGDLDPDRRTAARSPRMWMAFSERRVRTERPAFDPGTATLFDFRVPQGGDARFVHVLPVSPREALIQLTGYSRRPLPPPVADLAGYLEQVLRVGSALILYEGAGSIPLRPARPARPVGPVLPIGVNAGLLKASTGYAFERIQRHTQALVTALVAAQGSDAPAGAALRGPAPAARAPGSSARHRWLDEVFLQAIAHDPAVLERTFAALVDGNPADRLLAFLDESLPIGQELRLIGSMPKAPFIRAAAAVAARVVRARGVEPEPPETAR